MRGPERRTGTGDRRVETQNRLIRALRKLGDIPAYWVIAVALLFLIAAVLFLARSNDRLVSVALQNRENSAIIKAATGCKNTHTVEECEKVLKTTQAQQGGVFLNGINAYTVAAFECHRALPQTVPDAVFEKCIADRVVPAMTTTTRGSNARRG